VPRTLINFTPRSWLWLALGTSIAMLAIAHAFQTFGGLEPCHLCLQQRDVYWIAIPIAAAGLLVGRIPALGKYDFIFGWLLAITFLIGTGIAVRHAGAEWKWWPAPETCSGGGKVTAADIAKLLRGAKFAPPRCDVAAWRFLGLSMAGWNALISLKLTGWSIAFGVWRARTRAAV
jgi:disulfide bond formation protein DsbB